MKSKKPNFVVGFTTSKGLMLDLDRVSFNEAKLISDTYIKRFKLEGYMLIKSSEINYHVVFNQYLTWKKTCEYLCKIAWFLLYYKNDLCPHFTKWVLLQICKNSETLRISTKGKKRKPKILITYGKTDKLIKDYLQYYDIGD